jgi:hypothetical protein
VQWTPLSKSDQILHNTPLYVHAIISGISRSKERVDEGGDSRALGENDHEAKHEEKDQHRHQPPQLALPEEVQEFRGYAKTPHHTSEELHGLPFFGW